MSQGRAQAPAERINPSPNASVGGTQSERERETGTPLPKGSAQAGTTTSSSQQGEMRQGTAQSSAQEKVNPSPNTSVGGTQSERERETGAPLPKGSAQAGTTAPSGSAATTMDVRQAQQALKSKGYFTGNVDGVLGPDTQQAIRSFQNANGLTPTGTLDAQTAQRLGAQK
jgi:hypothetical protein